MSNETPIASDDERRQPESQQVIPGARREVTLTLDEVASVLKISVPTVKKLIREGALYAIRVTPRNVRVMEVELGEFMRRNRIRSVPN